MNQEELKEILFLIKSIPMIDAKTTELVLKWIKRLTDQIHG